MALSPERRARRRDHLVEVARTLIREGGDAGFSMAQLAERAGVSPATPYNLLGSKSEILGVVVRDDSQSFVAKLSTSRDASALTTLLAATNAVVAHYEQDLPFYRGLFGAARRHDGKDLLNSMLAESRALWRLLVRAAVDSGELSNRLHVDPFTDVLLRMIAGTSAARFAGIWDGDRFRLEMSHAIRLLIAGVAMPPADRRLLEEILAVQAALADALQSPLDPAQAERAARVGVQAEAADGGA